MFSNRIIETTHNHLYTAKPIEFDTRPAEVTTFIPQLYPNLTEELNTYTKSLRGKDTHRLIKNYVDIDFFEYPFVTCLRQDKNIVGFSTGYTRDFYRENDIRILTRYYQDSQKLRTKFTREILRPTTFNIIVQQLEMAKRLGYDNCFISREPRTTAFFKKFIDAVNSATSYTWELKEGPFLVAPDPPNPECWQTIAVTNLKESDTQDFWKYWRTE
jgi:hypothetical protein|tara:strand:+ start:4981 stop:5625 length:645 start_codon:yes stop_codon:yes gene_type:complete